MIGEVDIYGVFVPPLLLWTPLALMVVALLRRVLRHVGFYRLVWHRPAFDLALFVIVLGGLSDLSAHFGGLGAAFLQMGSP